MARIKDKKISIWELKTEKVNGITTKQYSLKYPNKIWAYYKDTGGNRTLDSVNGLVLNNTVEDCIFIINHRSNLETTDLIQYKGNVYTIQHINNGEDYKKDLILSCKLGEAISQYKGMTEF